MRIRTGTSGFAYKEWKGSFYPEKLPAARMLGFYAERLGTVEINNTFYRMPAASVLENWARAVPEGFMFVIKAPRRITHDHRLANAEDLVLRLLDTARVLGPKLGPFLFQLPPFLRKDLPLLEAFLTLLPPGTRAAFEFRHASWLEDDVLQTLAAREAALCVADTEEGVDAPLARTAPWGYLRLRRPDYDDAALAAWLDRIEAIGWQEAFVFFKHEDAGTGPRLAARLQEQGAGRSGLQPERSG